MAHSLSSHRKGLSGMKGFCRILHTSQIMDEMAEGLVKDVMDKNKPSEDSEEIKPAINDELVLAYLRAKELGGVAVQLSKAFQDQKKTKK